MKLMKLVALLAFALLLSRPASATEMHKNNYVEYCVTPATCVVGVFDKFGNFGVLVRADKFAGMLLGDVWKMGPTGDWVARLREPLYQKLKAAGLERVDFDISKDTQAIAALDLQVQVNANKCLWMTSGCVTGAYMGIGTWYGIAAAAVACGIALWDCDDLNTTNTQLLEQRRKLQEALDAEIERENGVEDDDKYIHAENGGSSYPPAGTQGGWFKPGASIATGHVTISESSPGGGGSPHPAHLH